jgi:hypothetical protein
MNLPAQVPKEQDGDDVEVNSGIAAAFTSPSPCFPHTPGIDYKVMTISKPKDQRKDTKYPMRIVRLL